MIKIFLISLAFTSTLLFADAPKAPVKIAEAPAEIIAAMPEEAPIVKNLPPAWLETAMDTAESVPVVGPVVVEGAKWLGVLASILTLFVTFLLGSLRALSAVLSAAKLAELALKVNSFSDGKTMYWLKFFSIYNAKKDDATKSS